MSHFSRIKTSIKKFHLLQKTLADLNLECNCKSAFLMDTNGNSHKVEVLVYDNSCSENIFGFSWDGSQYNIVADLQLWNKNTSFEILIQKLNQAYAINAILDSSVKEGFKEINKVNNYDGSITLVMQRWSQ